MTLLRLKNSIPSIEHLTTRVLQSKAPLRKTILPPLSPQNIFLLVFSFNGVSLIDLVLGLDGSCASPLVFKLLILSFSFFLVRISKHWLCGFRSIVIITAAQINLKHKLRFCAGSNPAPGLLRICNGENLWQWSQLEIRLLSYVGRLFCKKSCLDINIMCSMM